MYIFSFGDNISGIPTNNGFICNIKIGSYERNKGKVEIKRINKGIWKK